MGSEAVELPGHGQGSRIGKYKLLARLGKGGMGNVYLALASGPEGFSKLVVVKRLHDTHAEEPELRTMFLDEGRLAARLNHPNVVQTNEVGQEGNTFFITMEYLEGQPLNSLVKRVQTRHIEVHPSVWCRIVADALLGLHYAHELKDYTGQSLDVVHRDLSPHNIFVTYDGITKIVDFGIAKTSLNNSHTQLGVLKGKLAYMAPEQATLEAVDRRADIFVMGIVLWELVTGQRLMSATSDVETVARLLQEEIPRASQHVEIPAALDELLAKALKRNKDDRFQTALEMHDALSLVLDEWDRQARTQEISKLVSGAFKCEREKVMQQVHDYVAGARSDVGAHELPLLTGVGKSEREKEMQQVHDYVARAGLSNVNPEIPVDVETTSLVRPHLHRRSWKLSVIGVTAAFAAGMALVASRREPPPPATTVATTNVSPQATVTGVVSAGRAVAQAPSSLTIGVVEGPADAGISLPSRAPSAPESRSAPTALPRAAPAVASAPASTVAPASSEAQTVQKGRRIRTDF